MNKGMNKAPVLIAGFILGAFAVAGVGLVAVTHDLTEERIVANEHAARLREVRAIIPMERLDNDPFRDVVEVPARDLLGVESIPVYRIRGDGEPLAVVLEPVAQDGYAGPIRLIVSVLADGTMGGVRVLAHRETPGLGDKIELAKSDWLRGFEGKSLGNPPLAEWKVKRDGGAFDQFSGATITPRAIVRTVKDTLLLVRQQGPRLYDRDIRNKAAQAKGEVE